MADGAKRMGRPPGEPSKVVRLSLPLAALAKRWAEKTLRAEDIKRLLRRQSQAARYGAPEGALGPRRLSLASRRLPRSPTRFQRTADREPGRHFRRAHRRREHDGGWAVSGRYRRHRSRANGRGRLDRAGAGGRGIHGQALSQEGRTWCKPRTRRLHGTEVRLTTILA